MTETKLEPAAGRLLVTAAGNAWLIKAVNPDGSLYLADAFCPAYEISSVLFKPGDGEWIARDMFSLKAWARLTGVELR